MMVVKVCIGSSCHIKGAPEIVELMEKYIEAHDLKDEIELTGCFCAGKCNRTGVTIAVDDDVYTGITKESFNEFFRENILKRAKEL